MDTDTDASNKEIIFTDIDLGWLLALDRHGSEFVRSIEFSSS